MNGRVARELRKITEFIPSSERNYQQLEVQVMKKIYQFGTNTKGESEVNLVDKVVPAYIIECVDATRNFYQYLKKKYNNPEYTKTLHKLPSIDQLGDLAKTILDDKSLKGPVTKSHKKSTEE